MSSQLQACRPEPLESGLHENKQQLRNDYLANGTCITKPLVHLCLDPMRPHASAPSAVQDGDIFYTKSAKSGTRLNVAQTRA